MKRVLYFLALAACHYDASVGSTPHGAFPPLSPGHFQLRWARTLGGFEDDAISAVAADANGDVYVTGITGCAPMDFAASPAIPPPPPAPTDPNCYVEYGFVAKLSGADGHVIWGATTAENPQPTLETIAVDGFGGVYVAGWADYNPANNDICTPSSGVVLERFDSGGHLQWRQAFGPASGTNEPRIAVANDGTVALSAMLSGSITLGSLSAQCSDGCSMSAACRDAVLAVFGPDGSLEWSNSFQGPGAQVLTGLAFTITKELVLEGIGIDPANSYGDPVNGADVLRYAPDGTVNETSTIGWTGALRGAMDSADQYLAINSSQDVDTVSIFNPHGELVIESDQPVVQPRFPGPSALGPTGLFAAIGDVPTPAGQDTGPDNNGTFADEQITGAVFLGAYDEYANQLGASAFTGEYPGGFMYGLFDRTFSFSAAAATESAVIAVGNTNYSIDLGGGTMWAHGSGPLDPASGCQNGCQTGGADGVVAIFDWVSP